MALFPENASTVDNRLMAGEHAFVDESKARGYFVVVAILLPADLTAARKTMSGLVMPGQTRVHFVQERDSRRRQILDAIATLTTEVTIYDASSCKDPRKQRAACLVELVADLGRRDARMVVLEQDDSVLEFDRRLLYQQVRLTGCEGTLEYRHDRARSNPLLSIPDALAWCWSRGGHWRTRIDPLITTVRKL